MKKITIFSTATCAYCIMLKSYLQSKEIAYEEKWVDQDPLAVEELIDKSDQLGVPFTLIEQDGLAPIGIFGFDKSRIDQVLELA
jgi:glutaredoxin 3